MDFDDAEGLAAMNRAVPVIGEEEVEKIAPHLQEFATVGHLYRSIEAGFRHLADKIGEDQLFLGPASAQAGGALFGWPQLEPITSLDAPYVESRPSSNRARAPAVTGGTPTSGGS
jgi:hypothetical protein